MDSEKTLVFRGDASNLESTFDSIESKGRAVSESSSKNAKDLTSVYERLSQVAQESAEMLMLDAEGREGTSKEMLKYIEDEIKATERLNQINAATRRLDIEEQYKDDPRKREKALDELSTETKEEKLTTEILRDILDAILKTSREEVLEDRKAVQERISAIPHEERTFAERYQAGLLGIDGEQVPEEDRRQGRFSGSARGYGAAVIGSRNAVDLGLNMASATGSGMADMGGKAGAAGIALVLASMLGKKLYDAFTQYDTQQKLMYGISGRESTNSGAGYSKYGYSAFEYAAMLEPMSKARRSAVGVEDAAEKRMMLKRGIGLDEGVFDQSDQLALLEGRSGYSNIQASIAAMKAAGIVKGDDMSPVEDYLAIMVSLGKEQVSQLGKVDSGINTKMVSALGNMDETLRKSPEALSTMVNAVKGGLTGSSSPQSDALKYSVLKGIKPDASMFELMEMKENPFSEKNQKYLPKFLEQLKAMSGGKDDRFFMEIQQQFGLSASMSRKLGEGYNSGQLSKDIDKGTFNNEEGVSNLDERARKATSTTTTTNADFINMQTSMANGVANGVEWLQKNHVQQGDILVLLQGIAFTIGQQLGQGKNPFKAQQ